MDKNRLQEAVRQYNDFDSGEKSYMLTLLSLIKELDKSYSESLSKNIYQLVYREEDGDYHEFVVAVAKELRQESAVEYDYCSECRGRFSFNQPVNGVCPWCGFHLSNSAISGTTK